MTQKRVRVGKDNRPAEPAPPDPEPVAEEPTCSCPVLEVEDWHEVESDWTGLGFLEFRIPALLGVPIGHNQVLERARAHAAARGIVLPDDPMVLIGPGRFRRRVLVEVEDDADGPEVVRPGGLVFTRVLPAPPGDVKRLADETTAIAAQRFGRPPESLWLWLLTCRECDARRNFETVFVARYANTGGDGGDMGTVG